MSYKIGKTKHLPLESFLLEIWLTNRCDMNCSYCSARYVIHEKKKKVLTIEQIKRAVDIYASCGKNKNLPGKRKIIFTGGEPLLEFKLLKEAVSYIRTKEPDFEIKVATNGTCLTENRMDFLGRNNVEICLSVDGRRRVNDLHRKFGNNKKKSVFEVAMSNLKKGVINKKYMDHFHVSITLTPQTIDSLPDSMKFFRDDLGFKHLEVGLAAYEMWSQSAINRLRNVLRNLKSRFLATLKHEMDIKNVEIAFSEFLFSQFQGIDYYELARNPIALFFDGYFYPSDFVIKPPLDRKYSVGDLKHGIDLKRIETIASLPMFTDISRKCEYKAGVLSPIEGYYWGVVHKFTPDRLNKVLENTSQVNRVFNEEVEWYVKLKRVYERLVKTPSFGDFAHLPKYKSEKEIKSFRLIVRNDSDIAGLREGIDYFLYSPGNGKKLILNAMDNTRTVLGAIEKMVLYVLVKAKYLKKRIKLMVEIDTSAFDAVRLRYLNEHGVWVGTCSAGSPKFKAGLTRHALRSRSL